MAFVLGITLNGWAQTTTDESNNASHYTIGELDKLGKLELADIYVVLVHKINMLLPYIPFNQKGDAVSLAGMGIPNTKDNNGSIKKLDGSGGSHNEALAESMGHIIPYADKADIIKSILFLQSIIERIDSGL